MGIGTALTGCVEVSGRKEIYNDKYLLCVKKGFSESFSCVVVNSKSNVELLYRFVGAAYHQDNSVWQVPPVSVIIIVPGTVL